MNKVEGKVGDFCPNCKNCKGITKEHDGKTASISLTEVECEDPYDGMTKILAADSDICCSRFCDKISSLEDDLKETKEVLYKTRVTYSTLKEEKEELEARVTELIKASKRKDELIQDYREKLKKANEENGTIYEDLEYWKERCHKAETDVTTLNSKVEVLENKLRKADSIRDAVWNEEELKQKISDLETTISSKNTYIDILLNTNKDLTESNENLTKMIERRDRWVKEFKSDVYTLQNEILNIRNIAQKAYDDTNRD